MASRMTVARMAATAAIALTTGVIGFAFGRETSGGSDQPAEPSGATPAKVQTAAGSSDTPGADSLRAVSAGQEAAAATHAAAEAATAEPAPAASPRRGGGARAPNPTNPRPATSTGRRRVMLGDLDLTNIGHDRGDPDAPLVLIDFSDFGCPHCGTFARETYPVIDREYVQTGKVYLKYVPFLAGFANGREATRAAECAADQGKFWEMADAVYAAQARWQQAWDPHAELRSVAGTVGVDDAAYWSCYGVHRPDDRTRRATDAAEQVGVRVTPSFVLNGRPIEGALPLDAFRRLLDAGLLLEEARQ